MSNTKKTSKNDFVKTAMDDGKKVLCFIGGVVVGNTAANIIDKTLKIDETTGKVKKLITPIALMGVGMFGAYKFKGNESIKLISMGVAGAGVARTVKVLISKDVIQGLSFGEIGEIMGLGNTDEPMKLQIREFVPDLPALKGSEERELAENVDGWATRRMRPNYNAKLVESKEEIREVMDGGNFVELGETDIEIM